MRRTVLIWSAGFALLLLAFVAVVVTLNATLLSSAGFVRSYLDALARHDVAGALAMPGVEVADDAPRDLLAPEALGELSDIRISSELEVDDGRRLVVVEYRMGRVAAESSFLIEPAPPTLALFSSWRFAQNPLATVALTVRHDARFTVNDAAGVAPAADQPVGYPAFVPGLYVFAHESTYLRAAGAPAAAVTPGSTVEVAVDVQANDDFVAEVQRELNEYLDECTTQRVLMPTGCPFGQPISNRVEGEPQWSMAEYPIVSISPGAVAGEWTMPPTPGAAHLVVPVRSLFDGTLGAFDDDVPFTVGFRIAIDAEGRVTMTAQ